MLKPSISSVPLRHSARNSRASAPSPERWEPEFVAIPYKVFRDPELSHAAKLVYGRLRLYGGADGKAFPKHETLAAEVSIQPRQLRNVLEELQNAGWIDWKRTRTGCVYTVFPDRQNTAAEIGKKLPVRSAENCGSGSAKNCLQKRSLENHHQREEMERGGTAADIADSVGAAIAGTPGTEPPPHGGKAPAPPEETRLCLNPEIECEARFRERHPHLDTSRLLVMVRSELDGVSLTKFLAEDDRRTTAPENLHNPAGHYRRLARIVRNGEFVARELERAGPQSAERQDDAPPPPKDDRGRCITCNGTGYVKWDLDLRAVAYCTCFMGIDVRRADENAARRAKAHG